MVGWLVGWLAGRQAGWLAGWLVGWLVVVVVVVVVPVLVLLVVVVVVVCLFSFNMSVLFCPSGEDDPDRRSFFFGGETWETSIPLSLQIVC